MIMNMEGAYMYQWGHRDTIHQICLQDFMCVIRQIFALFVLKEYMHIVFTQREGFHVQGDVKGIQGLCTCLQIYSSIYFHMTLSLFTNVSFLFVLFFACVWQRELGFCVLVRGVGFIAQGWGKKSTFYVLKGYKTKNILYMTHRFLNTQ